MKRAIVLWCALSCSASPTGSDPIQVRMTFARPDFFAAPFPSDDLASADGRVDLSSYPNPTNNIFVQQITSLLSRDAHGFATTGGVFFSLTGDIDPASLPDMKASVGDGASVSLVSVDASAPDYGRRYPAAVSYNQDAGPYAAPQLLSIVPLQGIALRPKTLYAAVVTRAVHDTAGAAVAPSPEMVSLLHGQAPAGMPAAAFASYSRALDGLAKANIDRSDVVGLAAFTTGDPTEQMLSASSFAVAQPLPALTAPVTKTDTFPSYCVYATQLQMPDYQTGMAPYTFTTDGGGFWTFDASGHPVVARTEPAGIVLTVPRAPMPAAGYPLLVMIRTGGGGNRPLVDRGVQAVHNGPPVVPGSGPAMELASIGFAGASVDGPHASPLRNLTGGDEQFLMFNISNGAALRDNVRESALELAVFEHLLETLSFDVSDCLGATTPVHFDTTRFTLMGHSMGATIAPLTLSVDAQFKGAVLSGAGASWIENVLYKEQPLAVGPIIAVLLGYASERRALTTFDPVLTLIQWALEPADPLVYARLLISEPAKGESPRQILMEQGIVDHYILPPIANGISLSLGLDLVGTELDTTSPELMARPELTPLGDVLSFSGRNKVAFPVSANVGKTITGIVVQHPADGIEDGHEVMFQTQPPKQEYRCFLQSLAQGGAARVPDGTISGPCP